MGGAPREYSRTHISPSYGGLHRAALKGSSQHWAPGRAGQGLPEGTHLLHLCLLPAGRQAGRQQTFSYPRGTLQRMQACSQGGDARTSEGPAACPCSLRSLQRRHFARVPAGRPSPPPAAPRAAPHRGAHRGRGVHRSPQVRESHRFCLSPDCSLHANVCVGGGSPAENRQPCRTFSTSELIRTMFSSPKSDFPLPSSYRIKRLFFLITFSALLSPDQFGSLHSLCNETHSRRADQKSSRIVTLFDATKAHCSFLFSCSPFP